MLPLRYNVRSIVARRGASASNALGTAAVVFLLAASLMLSSGVRKTFALASNPGDAIVLRLGSEAEGNSVFEMEKAAIVAASPEVERLPNGAPMATREVLVNAVMRKSGAAGVANVQLRGVESSVLDVRPEIKLVAGRFPTPGTAEAAVGARIAGRFEGLEMGRTFDLKKNRPVIVVGIFEATGSAFESEVWIDREVVQTAYGRSGTVSSVRARVGERFEAFKSAIEGDRRIGCKVFRESEYYAKQSMATSTFVTVLGGAVSIFFAVAAILAGTSTMYSSVARRRREIGVLRALGFSSGAILRSFLVESLILASAGGLVGVLAALALGSFRFSMMNFASWSEIVVRLEPRPEILGIAFFGALLVGALGGLAPAIRAAHVPAVAALKG